MILQELAAILAEWRVVPEDHLSHMFTCNLLIAVFQLNAAKGTDSSVISVTTGGEVTAKVGIAPRALSLFPCTATVVSELNRAAVREVKDFDVVDVFVSLPR